MLPLQGADLFVIFTYLKALPWAGIYWAFSPNIMHERKRLEAKYLAIGLYINQWSAWINDKITYTNTP